MKFREIRNLSIFPVFLCLSAITGCAAVLIGVGAGVGAFAYLNGKLIRTYESEYHAAIRASKETLEALKIPINEAIGDELNTVIRAKRPDETPVTIELERLERNLTEISVRTGAVGVWDKKVSMQVHKLIDEKLVRLSNDSEYTAAAINNDLKPAQGDTTPTGVPAAELDENKPSQKVQKETSLAVNTQTDIRHTPLNNTIIIYFNHDSNELSEKATEKLDRVAKVLIENSSDQIVVNGFSDSTGPAYYNKMISESRANIVKVYLIGKGVNPSRVTSRGRGAQNFIASNETEEGRRLNRRVEIEFISGKPD